VAVKKAAINNATAVVETNFLVDMTVLDYNRIMKKFKWFIHLSRPRFWVYLFGPYIVGVAAAYNQLGFETVNEVSILLAGLFFLFPANLFIYGVNDLYDYETDKNNPKKKSYETLIAPINRRFFINVLSAFMIPFVAVLSYLFVANDLYIAVWSLILFLFFGAGYSTPPIRAKTKPFLDSFFNILYIFPGFVGYSIMLNAWPSPQIILAATAWVMAMHAFSAVPDIKSDKKAKINTIATVLGKKNTIILCEALYIASAALTFSYLGYLSFVIGFVYIYLMVLAYNSITEEKLFRIYKVFPKINLVVGAILFFAVITS
jgi:4-hydroxybenzoate polyprenyltransferase